MKKVLSIATAIMFTIVFIITQTGCTRTEKVAKSSYYMDTICEITIYDMEEMSQEHAEKAIDSAFSLCADYESLISATREESDIYKINKAKGQPVTCNEDTVELLKMGIRYGELSNGKFDITLGQVTDLWDFHSDTPTVPDEEQVRKALQAVDYKQVQIDGTSVKMTNADGKINLGGIGKGYIADRAAEHLASLGVNSAIINFGGNIVAMGDNRGDKFKIGIKDPNAKDGQILGAVSVADSTVVTSGVYERSFEENGKVYHHILDVNTGYPVDSDVVSVTLVAPKGYSGDCDAISTTCLILGVREGTAFVEGMDSIEAVFIDKAGRITKTSGMDFFQEMR